MRNIDEWLCNLYIQVKKVDLFDFRYHEEKIEFLVPKKFQKAMAEQMKEKKKLEERKNLDDMATTTGSSGASGEDDGSDEGSRDDSSSDSIDSDQGFDDEEVAEA